VRILAPPGVFRPHSDTWLLAEALCSQTLAPRATVLDLCTGSGALAIAAARRGARRVTAVDVSRRAVLTARLNARLSGMRVRVLRGDLFAPVASERFDVIVSNPPYLPAETPELPRAGLRRAWDAGTDGRVLLDRICAQAPAHLRPGGSLLLVHSSVCDGAATIGALQAGGLDVDVLARRRGPLGPLLAGRTRLLEERGLLAPGRREEEMLVIRGTAPARPRACACAAQYS
jgi:release factor glutamine methyltransferase